MLKIERFARIEEELKKKGSLEIPSLSQMLGCSEETVRRYQQRTSATGLRQRCICLYGFTERTAAFSAGICLAASLGALHCTTHRLDAFFRNFWQRESKKQGESSLFQENGW